MKAVANGQFLDGRHFGGRIDMAEMSLKLIDKPDRRAITLTEAKAHVRQEETADDNLIRTMTDGAIARAQTITRRQFITAKYEMRFDRFPHWFEFPRPPLQAVESDGIKYIDNNGDEQTFDAAKYIVDTFRTIGRVVLKSGESWPSVDDEINVVRVQFVAGYGDDPNDVPEDIREAIKLILGHFYENREDSIVGTSVTSIPQGALDLLGGHRILDF